MLHRMSPRNSSLFKNHNVLHVAFIMRRIPKLTTHRRQVILWGPGFPHVIWTCLEKSKANLYLWKTFFLFSCLKRDAADTISSLSAFLTWYLGCAWDQVTLQMCFKTFDFWTIHVIRRGCNGKPLIVASWLSKVDNDIPLNVIHLLINNDTSER